MLQLVNATQESLVDYLKNQLNHFFPDGQAGLRTALTRHLDEALARLERCINAVRMWRVGEFDYLHSTQYTIFLYFLANTIWKHERDARVCNKLFYLNKALNGIDCFYEIEMPEIFFIGHSVGIVLAKAHYSDYLVLYQNSTVGKNHGAAPVLEEGVVMYPNTAIIGRCHIGKGTVVAQGVGVINHDTPGNCIVFAGENGNYVFKQPNRNVLADIFRLDQ